MSLTNNTTELEAILQAVEGLPPAQQAVLYGELQTLTDEQKATARENIDASMTPFVVTVTGYPTIGEESGSIEEIDPLGLGDDTTPETTVDKTYAEILEAHEAGRICYAVGETGIRSIKMSLVEIGPSMMGDEFATFRAVLSYSDVVTLKIDVDDGVTYSESITVEPPEGDKQSYDIIITERENGGWTSDCDVDSVQSIIKNNREVCAIYDGVSCAFVQSIVGEVLFRGTVAEDGYVRVIDIQLGTSDNSWDVIVSDVTNKCGPTIVNITSSDGIAYTGTAEHITELYNGLSITIIPDRNSAAVSPTLNLNNLGAKSIIMPIDGMNSSVVTNGAKLATWVGKNAPMTITYDGTRWRSEIKTQSAQYMYGSVPIAGGGTGANNAETALSNLGGMPLKTAPVSINTSITLDLTHCEKVIRANSMGNLTITIPSNASVAFPIGTMIIIASVGTGTVTISPDSDVTLCSKDSKRTIDGQYCAVTLYKSYINIWEMWGALA